MTILEGDIKLLKSQVMADVPEGGGAATSHVVVDGASNSMFNDISELDRAAGRVNLRKLFINVATPDTEGYFGVNTIVEAPPTDPLVSVALFTTNDGFDDRTAAASRVESYLGQSSELSPYLLENHIAGQRVIQLFSRPGTVLPSPGETVVLVYRQGYSDEKTQYVRITRVTPEERLFTEVIDGKTTDYNAVVASCELSDALRYDFQGSSPSHSFARNPVKTLTAATTVTDAASYHGCVPLRVLASVGDRTIKAASVYTQLVPSSQTENVVLDQNPAANRIMTLATTPRLVQIAEAGHSQRIKVKSANRGFNYVTILTPLPAAGTLQVSYRALGKWYTIQDNGDGTMSGNGAGNVSYLTGSVSATLQVLPDAGSAVIFSWGATIAYANRSGQAGWRAPEYSFQLDHDCLDAGSFSVSWTSDSGVKTATANAAGVLSGHAAGEVCHATGMVYIRPTAFPDSGSQFACAYTYRTMAEEVKTGLTPDAGGLVSFTVAQVPVPGSIAVTWFFVRSLSASSGTTSSSGTASKSSSSITSSAVTDTSKTVTSLQQVGSFGYASGLINSGGGAIPGPIPIWESHTTVVPGHEVTINTVEGSTTSGATLTSTASASTETSTTIMCVATDDAAGYFLNAMGTANYASKSVTLKVIGDFSSSSYKNDHENANDWAAANGSTSTGYNAGQPVSSNTGGNASAKGGTWDAVTNKEVFAGAAVLVRYAVGSSSPVAGTTSFTPPLVTIDLAPYTADRIVPNSVKFTWMGVAYEDFEGVIYRGRTNLVSGTESGFLDYSAGSAVMTNYVVGTPGFSLDSMWTSKGDWHVSSVFFRTPVAPIKPTGLVFSVLDVNGTQIISTCDMDGIITGNKCIGKIDYETGVVEVIYGEYVANSGLSDAEKAEWWYNASLIGTSGNIWKPHPVDPQTLRYNAVSYFYLPLDAGILGLDPVRLPQDGRVPIFRVGGFAVLGHSAVITGAVANAQTVDCGRTRLARVKVIDNNDATITTGYTTDLDAGTVTFTNVTGYSQPVSVHHRVEDLLQVSDVQINGDIGVTRQLTHDYPLSGSHLSSALLIGDMLTRVSLLYGQATWTGAWSNDLIGSASIADYNDVLAPIEVTNESAITERWALRFTNTTAFDIIGENVGVIGTGNTVSLCAPVNPSTGTPYFSLLAIGWGAGWAAGNVLRFNTIGALSPIWVVRTIQQGPATSQDDSFTLLVRGDIDRP